VEEKRIYLLAELDEETQRHLGEISRKLTSAGFKGTQTPNLPYHLTLASFPAASLERILRKTEAVCKYTSAFPVRLTHIGLFGLTVLFLAPAVNYELLRLHDELQPDEPATGSHSWSPHATMLIDEPQAVLQALPIAENAFSPVDVIIKSVGVYEFFPAAFLHRFDLRS